MPPTPIPTVTRPELANESCKESRVRDLVAWDEVGKRFPICIHFNEQIGNSEDPAGEVVHTIFIWMPRWLEVGDKFTFWLEVAYDDNFASNNAYVWIRDVGLGVDTPQRIVPQNDGIYETVEVTFTINDESIIGTTREWQVLAYVDRKQGDFLLRAEGIVASSFYDDQG